MDGSVPLRRRRLVSEVREGFGDDESRRDGSIGGSGRLGFGDRWCTWEAISASRSVPAEVLEGFVGFFIGVPKLNRVGVLKLGLPAAGKVGLQGEYGP